MIHHGVRQTLKEFSHFKNYILSTDFDKIRSWPSTSACRSYPLGTLKSDTGASSQHSTKPMHVNAQKRK